VVGPWPGLARPDGTGRPAPGDRLVSRPQSNPPTTPDNDLPVHERPDVKPLVEKAVAELTESRTPGTMKTGADTAGGGGTRTLGPDDPPPPERRG
jgi:hypothetical protein